MGRKGSDPQDRTHLSDSAMYLGLLLPPAACVFVTCLFMSLIANARLKRRRLPLPPGPPGDFLLGNLRSLPTTLMWFTYEAWSKTYGANVMYLRALNQGILVISSLEAAKELLERQSKFTSDRPRFAMIAELMRWDWAIQFQNYDDRFRRYRKAIHNSINLRTMPTYLRVVDCGSIDLLSSFLDDPSDKFGTVKRHIAGLTMTLLYGEEPGAIRDGYVESAEHAVDGLVEAGNVGKFLVDMIPLLKYVPDWFPGADFKRKAREWRDASRAMIEVPYNDAKRKHDIGRLPNCVTKVLLDSKSEDESGEKMDEEMVMSCAGVVFVGAADTALSALYSFLYAMVMHPDVQRRVHEEMTAHIGNGRLPTLEDRPHLKYFDCVFLESLRWIPAVPLGVPHRVSEDCVLGKYRIPKGTTVLVNQWAILRNDDTYASAACFLPERFLPTDGSTSPPDPRDASFGYGRRSCPGKHFASQFLWLMMARLIATFVFEKARDSTGAIIEPDGKLVSSMITRPVEFPFIARPRSEELVKVVRNFASQ